MSSDSFWKPKWDTVPWIHKNLHFHSFLQPLTTFKRCRCHCGTTPPAAADVSPSCLKHDFSAPSGFSPLGVLFFRQPIFLRPRSWVLTKRPPWLESWEGSLELFSQSTQRDFLHVFFHSWIYNKFIWISGLRSCKGLICNIFQFCMI